jgi:uncharacterized membrane protein YdjX (TVP38/TMEM64 family)
MQERMKSLRALLPGMIVFVVVIIALTVGINAIGLERIREIIASAGVFAPLVYILVKVVTFVVAPLSSGPIQLFAGVAFGLIPGTIYTLVGEVIGGAINFWLARRFGRPVVERLVGKDDMPRIDRFISQIVDWKTLLYARIFLFAIYDFISYAVGFSTLSFRTFLLITTVAGIIPALVSSLLGTMLTEESSSLVLVYVLIGVASIVPLIFQKRIRRWLKLDKSEQQETA